MNPPEAGASPAGVNQPWAFLVELDQIIDGLADASSEGGTPPEDGANE